MGGPEQVLGRGSRFVVAASADGAREQLRLLAHRRRIGGRRRIGVGSVPRVGRDCASVLLESHQPSPRLVVDRCGGLVQPHLTPLAQHRRRAARPHDDPRSDPPQRSLGTGVDPPPTRGEHVERVCGVDHDAPVGVGDHLDGTVQAPALARLDAHAPLRGDGHHARRGVPGHHTAPHADALDEQLSASRGVQLVAFAEADAVPTEGKRQRLHDAFIPAHPQHAPPRLDHRGSRTQGEHHRGRHGVLEVVVEVRPVHHRAAVAGPDALFDGRTPPGRRVVRARRARREHSGSEERHPYGGGGRHGDSGARAKVRIADAGTHEAALTCSGVALANAVSPSCLCRVASTCPHGGRRRATAPAIERSTAEDACFPPPHHGDSRRLRDARRCS